MYILGTRSNKNANEQTFSPFWNPHPIKIETISEFN